MRLTEIVRILMSGGLLLMACDVHSSQDYNVASSAIAYVTDPTHNRIHIFDLEHAKYVREVAPPLNPQSYPVRLGNALIGNAYRGNTSQVYSIDLKMNRVSLLMQLDDYYIFGVDASTQTGCVYVASIPKSVNVSSLRLYVLEDKPSSIFSEIEIDLLPEQTSPQWLSVSPDGQWAAIVISPRFSQVSLEQSKDSADTSDTPTSNNSSLDQESLPGNDANLNELRQALYVVDLHTGQKVSHHILDPFLLKPVFTADSRSLYVHSVESKRVHRIDLEDHQPTIVYQFSDDAETFGVVAAPGRNEVVVFESNDSSQTIARFLSEDKTSHGPVLLPIRAASATPSNGEGLWFREKTLDNAVFIDWQKGRIEEDALYQTKFHLFSTDLSSQLYSVSIDAPLASLFHMPFIVNDEL